MTGFPTLRDHSVEVILENQHPSGAYIASPNFSVYGYSWFRDSSFIAESMRVVGQHDSAARFHDWAAGVVNARAGQIGSLIERSQCGDAPKPDEHLHCRFNLDGSTASEEWTNFQLDGFGTWLWAVARFHTDAAPAEVRKAVLALVPYLAQFWDAPSFDWWEESAGHVHVSSAGCIGAGLESISTVPWVDAQSRAIAIAAAAEIRSAITSDGITDGYLAKWFGSASVDASCLALIEPLAYVPSSTPLAIRTIEVIRERLARPGVHRHLEDNYFGGGQWLLLTAFLGLAEAATGQFDPAHSRLAWIEAQAQSNLDLPEQVCAQALRPDFEQPWIDKWGPVASPLLWSHAMYLLLAEALKEDE